MCDVWFCSSKGNCCVFISYVIDTTHLQYQLSTQEGSIAQGLSGGLSVWEVIEDLKTMNQSVYRVF